jgi:hypothetical protein
MSHIRITVMFEDKNCHIGGCRHYTSGSNWCALFRRYLDVHYPDPTRVTTREVRRCAECLQVKEEVEL